MMNKRPSKNDSEKEILRMQREYLSEKRKNKELQPAAKVVRLSKDGSERTDDTRSAFARSRNLSKPKPTERKDAVVIGDIVERISVYDDSFTTSDDTSPGEAFPKPIKLDLETLDDNPTDLSLFGRTVNLNPVQIINKSSIRPKLGDKSVIIQGTDADVIHEENVKKLESLSEEDIIKERTEIMKNMDPSLIEFLMSKRNGAKDQESVKMDVDSLPSKERFSPIPIINELANESNAHNWLHFDVLEPEKLEWTKDVEENIKTLKPGESFEARFNWKGVLLPYNESFDTSMANHDLYLHGDEANRPGYTLQELFRLARATVLQQRVSAINAVAGILNIYNQGFYDGILELPISKIFFFLRFALDENTPAIVEASSRALAYLFYNDTDEVLLDTIYEVGTGMHQPAMEKCKGVSESDPLEDAFGDMSLESSKPFASTVDDAEFDKEKESMNDFHLAETDLLECLVRTNILERIRYILLTIRPEAPTVTACVKILIRIARTNKDMAMKIVMMDTLMQGLIENYLPRIEKVETQYPEPLVLKLFRILASHDTGICIRLQNLGVLEIVKGFIFSRKDINTRLIQMQIETFRFIRLYLTLIPDEKLYTDILPALRYMLEWHYQNLVFDENGPFIIKQHATAVLNILSCGDISSSYPIFVDILEISLCKWFNAATRTGLAEFSQKLLLATCLNICGQFMTQEPAPFMTFVNDYLRLFLQSATFKGLTHEMRSLLLSSQNKDRSNVYNPLPNLGSIIIRNKQSAPTLIFSKNYPAFFLHSLISFCHKLSSVPDTNAIHEKFNSLIFDENIRIFINAIITDIKYRQQINWYLKIEIMLLLSIVILAISNKTIIINNKTVLHLSMQLLTCLSQEMTVSILSLLDDVVFNFEYYEDQCVTKTELDEWRSIYVDTIVSSLKINKFPGKSLTVYEWQPTILIKSWPYHLLSIFLNILEAASTDQIKINKALPERQIIETVMTFTSNLETSGITIVTPTEMLMYLMTAYLGPDSKFLDPDINELLLKKTNTLRCTDATFDLNSKLESRKSFESLYSVFLDTFQSSSYGDEQFSALVMIPLAQQYDVKWRKRVWSEYIAVLRFITCTETMLFGGIDAYLSPDETDVSLLKCYHQAISNSLIRKGSVPYLIAQHHLNRFNERRRRDT